MRLWLSKSLVIDTERADIKSDGLRIWVGGESGSGKSFTVANITGQVIEQGGQAIVLDAHGEHGGLWAMDPSNVVRVGYGGAPPDPAEVPIYLEAIREGKTLLLDLLLLSLREPAKLDALVLDLMKGLLDIRVQDPSFTLLVAEEAHLFAPQMMSKGQSDNVKVFIRITTGGRKWGIHSLFCTQRQSLVDVSVLASCNTRIFLRSSDWKDWKKIRDYIPSSLGVTYGKVKHFRSGEAIVTCRWLLDTRAQLRLPSVSPRVQSA